MRGQGFLWNAISVTTIAGTPNIQKLQWSEKLTPGIMEKVFRDSTEDEAIMEFPNPHCEPPRRVDSNER
jgi:hypothetical protein